MSVPSLASCDVRTGLPAKLTDAWACPVPSRFGRVEVSCEGYDHPDDPYVLKGATTVIYRLMPVLGSSQLALADPADPPA